MVMESLWWQNITTGEESCALIFCLMVLLRRYYCRCRCLRCRDLDLFTHVRLLWISSTKQPIPDTSSSRPHFLLYRRTPGKEIGDSTPFWRCRFAVDCSRLGSAEDKLTLPRLDLPEHLGIQLSCHGIQTQGLCNGPDGGRTS